VELKEALENMVYQFAYTVQRDGRLHLCTRGLSALEDAFEALGWPDPMPMPEGECDVEGCTRPATCGTPTADGYRNLCWKHFEELYTPMTKEEVE